MRRIRASISGCVQGVGYRRWAEEAARGRGLVGWVKNLPDGQVQTLAEGTSEAVAAFLEDLGQGPRYAQVAKVSTEDLPACPGEFANFQIIH